MATAASCYPPPFRGRGIARRICEALIDAARRRRFRRVRLEVREDNAAGQALYEALGFERIARLPAGYYANGHGGWRMQRSLDGEARAGAA